MYDSKNWSLEEEGEVKDLNSCTRTLMSSTPKKKEKEEMKKETDQSKKVGTYYILTYVSDLS